MKLGADLTAFAARIGHSFTRPELLLRALTHASIATPTRPDNQRLEFLGDRVLGLVMAEALLHADRAASEGQLAPRFNALVRKDTLCWISGESAAERQWLDWADRLQAFLNRELLLGLFSFESHFAHYREGDFYRRHVDAFRGESNRMLSLVAYLNPTWQAADGGELVIYPAGAPDAIRVLPTFGTVAVFLSEDFEHEVLPAGRDRYSIAGWFRLNSSSGRRADPPT